MIMWLLSYSGSVELIDAFYIWGLVNSWYYATLFWVLQLLWWVTVSLRNSWGSVKPDDTDDHSMNISII
jgi:hypothetical protein